MQSDSRIQASQCRVADDSHCWSPLLFLWLKCNYFPTCFHMQENENGGQGLKLVITDDCGRIEYGVADMKRKGRCDKEVDNLIQIGSKQKFEIFAQGCPDKIQPQTSLFLIGHDWLLSGQPSFTELPLAPSLLPPLTLPQPFQHPGCSCHLVDPQAFCLHWTQFASPGFFSLSSH